MAGTSGQPMILGANGVERPSAIPFTSSLIDEAYIQNLLDLHPELIPIDELPKVRGPLISLGREISTSAGPIDNLFVSPEGDITIVEAKLWRNPEARRKVVAQILDYASAVAQLSYDSFSDLVASNAGAESLWAAVSAGNPAGLLDEASFVDAVTRNLASGNFLLLIVGDGIKEDVQNLTDTLARNPNLGFHLELIELRLYEMASGDRLVVPSIVGRSNEVTRAIVEVRTSGDAPVQLNIEAMAEEPDDGPSKWVRLESIGEFYRQAEENAGSDWVELIRSLTQWWTDEMGGTTVLNMTSLSLSMPYRHHPGNRLPIALFYVNGGGEFQNLPLSRSFHLFEESEIDGLLRSIGLGGRMRITFGLGAVNGMDADRIKQALALIAERVNEANNSETPPS